MHSKCKRTSDMIKNMLKLTNLHDTLWLGLIVDAISIWRKPVLCRTPLRIKVLHMFILCSFLTALHLQSKFLYCCCTFVVPGSPKWPILISVFFYFTGLGLVLEVLKYCCSQKAQFLVGVGSGHLRRLKMH